MDYPPPQQPAASPVELHHPPVPAASPAPASPPAPGPSSPVTNYKISQRQTKNAIPLTGFSV